MLGSCAFLDRGKAEEMLSFNQLALEMVMEGVLHENFGGTLESLSEVV